MTYRRFDEEPSLHFGGQSALENNKEQFVPCSLVGTIQLIMRLAAW